MSDIYLKGLTKRRPGSIILGDKLNSYTAFSVNLVYIKFIAHLLIQERVGAVGIDVRLVIMKM